MVDTQDLKSCDHYGCAGSSPAPGTEKRASVRARANTLALFSHSHSHTHTELHALSHEPFNEFVVRVVKPDSLTILKLI